MNFVKKIIKKIFQIKAKEAPEILSIKTKFQHEVRGFNYGITRRFADSFICHATPGILETVVQYLLNIDLKKKLLNLGGGIGQVAKIFKELGFDVYNLDIEVPKNQENEKNIQFNLNDDKALPFAEKNFQVVVCQEVVEHLENPWKLFKDVKRVLETDGLFIVTTPNPQSIRSRLRYLCTGYFDWFTPECFEYHINPIFNWELNIIAKENGFQLIEIMGSGDYFKQSKKKLVKDVLLKNEGLIYVFKKSLLV
jgi:2-polyprenyl-3-methyl-5-hydroxy-6-metoxy-1,4-benzoquinol methylase